jgi:hypothetical protein
MSVRIHKRLKSHSEETPSEQRSRKVILSLVFPIYAPAPSAITFVDNSISHLEREIREIFERPISWSEVVNEIEKLLKENNIDAKVEIEWGGMTGYDTVYVDFVLDR